MEKLAIWIIKRMIQQGVVKEGEKGIYEYGFQIFFEVLLCLGTCLMLSIYFKCILEMGIFLALFIPLRSYAGGLHLKSFWSCYILSCATAIVVILAARYIVLPFSLNITISFFLLITVRLLYPVENKNRQVDQEEDMYFKKKLCGFLFIDFLLAGLCVISEKREYLQVGVFTFLVVVITMIVGKYQNKKY